MQLPTDIPANYVFPNNQIPWSVLIVIYPYITGLIAGAFTVSGLSHVFKVKEFKPIANFALIMAFCFGLFAGAPLLVHLGHPERAFNIYFTPHLTSAMSLFGYIYTSYLLLLTIEIWFVYRPYFIRKYNETSGLEQGIWHVLTLGVTRYHPDSARVDDKITVILAGVGIPWAFMLHGYVGFIFGSVKANPWWASPLQPIIFLLSAIVSGMAMLLVMYVFLKWREGAPYDYPMLRKFSVYLWGIFILDFAIELLEVGAMAYEHGHHWAVVEPLLKGPLWDSFVIWQLLILSGIPLVVLGYVSLSNISGKAMIHLATLGSIMLILQVLFMRYNTVIGGQMISKSERGFLAYDWTVLGRDGVLTSAAIFAAPFVVYYIVSRFLPIFEDPHIHSESQTGTAASRHTLGRHS